MLPPHELAGNLDIEMNQCSKLPPQDTPSRYQCHPEKRQCSYNQIGRPTRRGHPPDAGAGDDALGTIDGAWWRPRFILFPNGSWVITPVVDQLLTRSPVVVSVQVVGVRAVLSKVPLCCSVGGEVSTIQVSATSLSTTTATVVGIGLTYFSVVIRVEPVGIAGIPLPHGLSLLLRSEVGAVQVSPATSSAAIAVRVGFAGHPVAIPVEVVGIAW